MLHCIEHLQQLVACKPRMSWAHTARGSCSCPKCSPGGLALYQRRVQSLADLQNMLGFVVSGEAMSQVQACLHPCVAALSACSLRVTRLLHV